MWLGLQVTLQSLSSEVANTANRHTVRLPDSTFEGEGLVVLELAGQQAQPLPLLFDMVIERMVASKTIYSEGDGSFAFCGNERCDSDNQEILWFGRHGKLLDKQKNPDWFTDSEQRSTWKIEGNLFDGTASLDHCTLVGFAPLEQWRYLLELIAGTDPVNLVFQFQQLGIYCLPEDLFSKLGNQ